MIETKNTLYH